VCSHIDLIYIRPTSRMCAGRLRCRQAFSDPWLDLNEMKTEIHPQYLLSHLHCSSGNDFYTRSTKPELHVEICSQCHPFYTGKQKLMDTGGRVERFQRRLERADQARRG